MIFPRERYLQQLIRKEGNGLIKVITGIRRCGKSYLLFNLFRQHLLDNGITDKQLVQIALDDRRNLELRDPDHMLVFLEKRISGDEHHYVLLDEIQYMPEFVDILNTLLHFPNTDVYVTGSNSKFLSNDILTEFRGRGDEIQIHPLSFKEFSEAYAGRLDEAWEDYTEFGGLPYTLFLTEPDEKERYLQSLCREVYLTDLIERHHIRNTAEFNELMDILASSIGSLTNPLKLSNTFKTLKNKRISDTTIFRYIGYLTDAFLIHRANRFDIKGKKYINSLSKYYYEDIGLRNARLGFRQYEPSHIMENILFNELRIRGFQVDVGILDKYSKDENQKTIKSTYEVDFVATKGSQKYYIQSAYRMDSPQKEAQEKFSLRNIKDSFKKIVVVRDNIRPRRDESGILTIGIRQFLMDENALDL